MVEPIGVGGVGGVSKMHTSKRGTQRLTCGGRHDLVLDGEKVLDDHVLLDLLVEYVLQQVGLDYPVLLVEGAADKPVVCEGRLDHDHLEK